MSVYGRGDTRWFVRDRFGMFIHWGLYAMPARHEWVRNRELIDDERYQLYFDLFDPDLFSPREWARAAAAAGMKYMILTTKHHDGFCLWDTRFSDYKATNTTAKRDLVREVVDAFREEGLRIGFYYSLLDWHHPDFTIDSIHPLRERPDRDELNQGRDMKRYARYMRDQVGELLTNYGQIDILWFDFSYPSSPERPVGKDAEHWESEAMIRNVRELAPDIIINNRLGLDGAGDIVTPEQFMPDTAPMDAAGQALVWEGCQTLSGSWGYYRDEMTWKSVGMCIQMLVNHVALGGNLIMNVGPTARGFLDVRARDRLDGYARWMRFNARAIHGCGAAPAEFPAPANCRYTWNPETRRLYLHCYTWPFKHVTLPNLHGKLRYAQLLADGSEIPFRDSQTEVHSNLHSNTPQGAITLNLPVTPPEEAGPVAVIELILA